jgi:hypothetical protein
LAPLVEVKALGIAAIFLMSIMSLDAQIPRPDLQNKEMVRREMMAFNPRYLTLMGPRSRALRELEQQVMEREAKMRDVSCSHQIVTELRWLMGSTVDTERIDTRLDDLRASLAHPELEARAREQESDGSWGRCYDAWFFRLDASYDGHFSRDEGGNHIPLLDRVNSPKKLTQYVNSISVSDVAHSGVDHRREMNEALATLVRLIVRGQPRGYRWHPEMKATLLDLLKQKRNPGTGWWGERYQREGRIDFVDDMSMTFHIVSYLKGEVPDLDKVGNTLLELKDLEYPIGWREDGGYLTHHNMDVVVLFQYAWPHMNEVQRRAAAIEIERMLQWCLTESVLPDGSFRAGTGGEDSLEEDEYFGVAFLARAGYFDASRRFWTDQPFPEAENLRRRLIDFIQRHKASGAAGGAYYESALHELGAPAPAK